MAYAANFQTLHLKLSRKLFDPVASIATNGEKVSAALRSDYLNRANKFIQLFFMSYDKEPSRRLTQELLSGIIKVQTINPLVNTGAALATDYSFDLGRADYIISASATTVLPKLAPVAAIEMINSMNPFTKNGFMILSGKFYAYVNYVLLNSGVARLWYIATDQSSEADGATDIVINAIWYDTLIDLAATYYFEDKGDLPFAAANQKRTELVLAVISGANPKSQ